MKRCAKVSYKTKKEAMEAMEFIQSNSRRTKKPIRYYYCKEHKAYHLTSQEKLSKPQKKKKINHLTRTHRQADFWARKKGWKIEE